jgi:hypothetical protein
MKKLIVVLVLLAGAMSAQARINETRAQIVKRFSARALVDDDVRQHIMTFHTKNTAFVGFYNGRSVIESYVMSSAYSNKDANEVVRIVLGRMPKWRKIDTGYWVSSDGVYGLMTFPGDGLAKELKTLPHIYGDEPHPDSTPVPRPPVASYYGDPSRTPNDCSIIASKAYHELKPTTAWCQVISAGLILPAGASRHAVVAFKYQKDGHVLIYDEMGSFEIDTTLEDTEAIKLAWQAKLNDLKVLMIIDDLKFETHD